MRKNRSRVVGSGGGSFGGVIGWVTGGWVVKSGCWVAGGFCICCKANRAAFLAFRSLID